MIAGIRAGLIIMVKLSVSTQCVQGEECTVPDRLQVT